MAEIDYNNNCFPGMLPDSDFCFRFIDKEANENEQMLYNNYWREILNLYGQRVTYYVNAYNVKTADNLYGEQPTKQFAPGVELVMAIELNENADTLSRYGFSSDDEVTATVHITAFQQAFAPLSAIFDTQYGQVEPKSGDVFALTEYGSDRPKNRGPKMFEVTDRTDEDIASINQLGGHYVWRLKAKRFEYSFEPGLSGEQGNDQVYDNSYAGVLSGVGNNSLSAKKYEMDIDEISKTTVYDMSANNDTSVYGGYY